MKRLLVLLFPLILLAQDYRDPHWQIVGVGPLAARPLSCFSNRDVYICNGAGCASNGGYYYCTANNTWSLGSSGGSGALAWGDITGLISNQADLVALLATKVDTTRTVSTTSPLAGGGALSGNLTLSIPVATNSVNGYLSSADHTTFAAKESPLTFNSPLSRSVNAISLQTVPGTLGGTGNSFWQLAGPATSLKTWTIPNASIDWTALTGVGKWAAGIPSVVTGTLTNCVLVDGTSSACSAGGVTSYVTTTHSATPTYTVPAGTNAATTFTEVLTSNVTSSTLTGGLTTGQIIAFRICQDGTGGRTYVRPTNVLNFATPETAASACTAQAGIYDATNVQALGGAVITGLGGVGQGFTLVEGTAPANPASGSIKIYGKTSDNSVHIVNSAGTDFAIAAGGGAASSLARAAVVDDASIQFRDEFLTANYALGATVPTFPWTLVTPTAGTPTYTTTKASEANHWGIVQLSTTATSGDDGYLFIRGTAATYIDAIPRLDNVTGWWYRHIFRPNSTTSQRFRTGFTDTGPFSGTLSNGCFLRHDTGVTANYIFVCTSATVETATDSTVAPNTSNWIVFDMYSDVAGTVKFQINGGTVTSIAYTGSVTLNPGIYIKALSASARSIDNDFLAFYAPVTR